MTDVCHSRHIYVSFHLSQLYLLPAISPSNDMETTEDKTSDTTHEHEHGHDVTEHVAVGDNTQHLDTIGDTINDNWNLTHDIGLG